MSKDPLGDRIKKQYEDRTRYFLPRRTYTILRVDFKAFHSFVAINKCSKPFDNRLSNIFECVTQVLLKNIQGAKLAYTQSDEISILLTDFDTIKTDAWFDNNLQKLCSVTASMASAVFAEYNDCFNQGYAFCDCRAFTIPDPIEVANYFIWRQKDCIKNAISSIAQSLYAHKELEGKSCNERRTMIEDKIKCSIETTYDVRHLLGYTLESTRHNDLHGLDFSKNDHKHIYSLIPTIYRCNLSELLDKCDSKILTSCDYYYESGGKCNETPTELADNRQLCSRHAAYVRQT